MMRENTALAFPFSDRWEVARANRAPARVQRTRERLRHALIALMSERSYDQISIQDLVKQAGITRATFYLHFGEKNDLFGHAMREVADAFLRLLITAPISEDINHDRLCSRYDRILNHIRDHATLYRTALCEPGAAPYAAYFSDALEVFSVESVRAAAPDAVSQDDAKVRMIGRFCAAGLVGLWRWWLESDMSVPISVVAAQMADLMMKGPLASAAIPTA